MDSLASYPGGSRAIYEYVSMTLFVLLDDAYVHTCLSCCLPVSPELNDLDYNKKDCRRCVLQQDPQVFHLWLVYKQHGVQVLV